MKHQSSKTSRAIILALVLLAIAASPTLASGAKPPKDTLLPPALRDSFTSAVSYPAAPLSSVGDTERRFLQSLSDNWPRTWWRSARQPLLDSLLPGIEVFRVPTRALGIDGPSGHDECFALYKGKLYRFEKLNDLLQDAGLTADTSNWPAIARVAALFAVFGREFVKTATGLAARGRPRDYIDELTPRGPLDGPPWTPDLADGMGFPSLTILSVKQQVPGMGNRYPVRLRCLVDGKLCSLDVYFQKTSRLGWSFGTLWSVGLASDKRPLLPLDPPRRSHRSDVGKSLSRDDLDWTLGVRGEVKLEINSSGDSCWFVVADVNHGATGRTARFGVDDVGENETSYIVFVDYRVYPPSWCFSYRCDATGPIDSLIWIPDSSRTAMYGCYASRESSAVGFVLPEAASAIIAVGAEDLATRSFGNDITGCVHYMLAGDRAGPLGAGEAADTVLGSVQYAWIREGHFPYFLTAELAGRN